MSARASRTLRVGLLGLAAWGVLLLAALEGASLVLFYAATGVGFSFKRTAQEQAAAIQAWVPPSDAPAPVPTTAAPAPREGAVEGRPENTPRDQIPHPFMGYVYDPESPRSLSRVGRGGLRLTEHGFFSLPAPPGEGEEVSVAVFGGSVAAYLAVDGRAAMARALAAHPALRDKRIRMYSMALGAYKQPQMLGALAYLMALGQRFDAVVELDGFNEVALSYGTFKTRGVFPGYPRDWDELVRPVPDVDQLRRIGRVAYWQEWRTAVARRFASRPLSWSVTAGLVWKCVDRVLGGELAQARAALVNRAAVGYRYRERGPVRHYATDEQLLADIARIWSGSSVQMRHLCAGAGSLYFHFLQPNQYVPGSKPLGSDEKAAAYRADSEYRVPVEKGYPLLQAEGARLAAQGVEFHDLTSLYAGIADPLYIDTCCHVNAKGNALMGEAVGKVIAAGWKR